MKASLKALRAKPEAVSDAAHAAEVVNLAPSHDADERKTYIKPETRKQTRQISAHFPGDDVLAFRILAAEQDMDVQELLGEAINMIFERYGRPNRVPVTSGRRKPLKR